jgi:cyclopropane-fatty-acyl-phospholipid synthase
MTMTETKSAERMAEGQDFIGLPASVRIVFLLLNRLSQGHLQVALPDGHVFEFGETGPDGACVIKIADMRFFKRVLRHGSMGFAESYMDGDWSTPDLAKLLTMLNRNMTDIAEAIDRNKVTNLLNRLFHVLRPNTRAGSKRNIHAHYDLGNEFYSLWLDTTMTYSSALFQDSQQSLRGAQNAKYRALAESANIGPDDHVLEIGCGWGGFAEYAAREIGCKITGITISAEQLDFARNRIKMAGLADKVDFQFRDYRDVSEPYDKIVSIEMFEAVGESYWPTYFGQIKNLLKPGGRAGLQIITIANERFAAYRKKADFIQRYIFPGGMLPSPERLDAAFEAADLRLAHREDFCTGLCAHIGRMARQVHESLAEVEALGFDKRFKQMWRYYLAYCEAGFRTKSIDVSHFTLEHA